MPGISSGPRRPLLLQGVGVVGTRVPLAGLPQPSTLFRRSHQGPGSSSLASLGRVFPSRGASPREAVTDAAPDPAKDQALQAWRASRGPFLREGPFTGENTAKYWRASAPPRETLSRGFKPKGLARPPASRVPSTRSRLCLRDRAHMGSAPSAESRARLRAMTSAAPSSSSC